MKCWPELKMECETHSHRERLATGQLTLSPCYDVPLLRLRSRECSTAILYTSRECSTAILYTSRECSTAILYTSRERSTAILYTRRKCSTAIVYTYPVLEPGETL